MSTALGLYEDTQQKLDLASASFHVLDLNIRSKNFRCIIIFVQKIFVRFQRAKIFLRRKKANYGSLIGSDLLDMRYHNEQEYKATFLECTTQILRRTKDCHVCKASQHVLIHVCAYNLNY